MSEVLLVKRGSVTKPNITAARKAGIVVIETDELTDVQFVRAGEIINNSDMLWAALEALTVETGTYGRDQRERLAHNMFRVMDDAYAADRAARAAARA